MRGETSINEPSEGEGLMILRHRGGMKRLLSLGLAAGLLFALAGDGGRAQSYTITGTDPLEVLELKIKPNVIVVLDSSGSMAETLSKVQDVPTSYLSGDHPESKLGKAKAALEEVFSKNETKVSFAFASYTQEKKEPRWMGSTESATTLTIPNPTNSADYHGGREFRFIYFTSDVLSGELQGIYAQADPVSDDVQVAQAAGDLPRTRGLQAWQEIRPANWGAGGSTAYLYWKEGTGVVSCTPNPFGGLTCSEELNPVTQSCGVTIATGFYRAGADLAAELQTRMNTCGANDYAVTYDPGTGTFAFSRTAGTADFEMYWSPACSSSSSCPNNFHSTWQSSRPSIGPALGAYYLSDEDNTEASFIFNDVDGDGTPETKVDVPLVSTPVAYSLAHRKAATTAGGCPDNDPLNEACYAEPRDLDGDGVAETSVTFYNLYAARFWNGETIVSDSAGNVCDVLPATATSTAAPPPGADGVAGTADDTPVVWVRKVTSCGDSFGQTVPFLYAGIASHAGDHRDNVTGDPADPEDGLIDRGMAFFGDPYGNTDPCGGIQFHADLRPCDSGCLQYDTQIAPWLDMEVPLNANNELVPSYDSTGSPNLYGETTNGVYQDQTVVWMPGLNGGLRASGSTPLSKTLRDVKGTFADWWSTAGPVDCPVPDGSGGTTDPFSLHDQPAAPTIVVFVSDGNDTCADSSEDLAALDAALAAEELYTPVDTLADPGTASSVRTYMIAFGEGADPTRLNWIAWGGSGLGQGRLDLGMPDVAVTGTRWVAGGITTQEIDDNLAPLRAQCTTCTDALVARDGDELGETLQRIIDQGATSGNFSASRQSITDSVYEYVYLAGAGFDATDPDTRYKALAPTRFISTFSLPGFRGELTAWQDRDADGTLDPVTDVAWRAGEKLLTLVQDGFLACAEGVNLCTFAEISGPAGIQRQIYTTDGNGVYGPGPGGWASDPAALASAATMGGLSDRLELWPPHNRVTPNGEFDDELGIPTDLATLHSAFGACMGEDGATLPPGCPGDLAVATKEAREMILAFMAGGQPAGALGEPRRDTNGNILYRPRSWVLAESTQATAAVLGPPFSSEPEVFTSEYRVFRDGRDSNGDPLSAGMVARGCGLRHPAEDTSVQPVMTQVFLPANDMLHAFRAGPCDGPCTTDTGGEELWGFVPYDLLPALRERFTEEPQGREDHVYMLARGVRYADVFFPVATTDTEWCGAGDGTSLQGIWRRVVFIGRGAGGKFLTALDVTAPGDLTTPVDMAPGPVPLWSRGNPDYAEATRERVGSTDNHNATDTTAYTYMGETWSLPVVALVDSNNENYDASPRDPARKVTHALFTGSGYGNDEACFTGVGVCEGTTFYTLDALTGDVIATADVGQRAALVPVTLDDPDRWFNAIVANPAGFNPRVYSILETVHPSASKVTRVYVGDLHGRLWKFLTASPDIQIRLANLSTTVNPGDPAGLAPQPVATAAGLIGLPPYQGNVGLVEPYVYVTSGNDRRGDGPFKMFGFRDTGGDTDTQLGAPVDNPDDPAKCPSPCNVQTYNGNAGSELLFAREYDEGAPLGTCGNPIAGNVFRGTVQPATSFEPCDPPTPSCTLAMGRVFFGGTRLNLPGTEFAPPTPIACGSGTYPCRSNFDSIVYALGAETGLAAYDLNSSGDDAYRIYRDQRISAVSMAADPAQGGGSRVLIDEGQLSGAAPTAPPPAGVPPTVTTSGTGSVVMSRDPNFPPPAVRIGSAVCQ